MNYIELTEAGEFISNILDCHFLEHAISFKYVRDESIDIGVSGYLVHLYPNDYELDISLFGARDKVRLRYPILPERAGFAISHYILANEGICEYCSIILYPEVKIILP